MKNQVICKKRNYLKFLILIVLLILGISCVETKKVETKPLKDNYIYYPPLPNKPRLQYLTTISTSKDIRKANSSFFKFVVGDDEEKPEVIKKPYGIDVHDGVLYICDMSAGTVDVLDLKKGTFKYFGLSGPGKLGRPINLKVDKKENLIYVADNGRKQVVVFDENGKYIKAYGLKDQFVPVDVDFNDKLLFVCDVKNHQIHVLDKKTGAPKYKIGKPGSGDEQLYHPTNICYYKDKIYVSDTTNFRVQIFDIKEKPLGRFGQIGDRPGSFSRPKGLDIDNYGNLYIVDAAFENVQIFNKNNQFVHFFLKSGNNRDNVNLPAGIVINYDSVKYFKNFISPRLKAEYLLFVTSQFGVNKVNVYAYGTYK